ncbi:MAG: HNH endonuclease [Gammaproteobacteria bacterium]|nr:HNH endonuclease [Gammaproteobacteria bacterium]|tara:strand:+ start:71 stop:655 length:585 start_codon:yes stop_codon:yes gene_type:complete
MYGTQQILRLNSAGQPTGWINYQTAVRLYCNDQIAYECGSSSMLIRGGYNRVLSCQSSISLNSIIATRNHTKLDYSAYTPPLTNVTLFKRDANTCMYCGNVFLVKELSRDHVLPISLGGTDSWTNVVTACRRCNNHKGGRTPEDARMLLIAIPFSPSRVEYLILRGRKILTDQMEFLISHISKNSPLFQRYTTY